MTKLKVCVTGGDQVGWALDEDVRLTKRSLEGIVDLTDIDRCDIVHSVWWEPLLTLPPDKVEGRTVICHMSGEPFRYLGLPQYRHATGLVDCWITQSTQASRQCRAIGMPYVEIPYVTDVGTFRELPSDQGALNEFRTTWKIPQGRYLIGSVHRDSSGTDVRVPKLEKGPDVFAEIVGALHRQGFPIHVVLAGPRRHWLRQQLDKRGVPYTFIGEIREGDDYHQNRLSHDTINTIYNILDLYVVSSRSEGGPRSLLEAAAARCKIVSTRVGVAEDLLDPGCLFATPIDAITIIKGDIRGGTLQTSLAQHYDRIQIRHRPESVRPLFEAVYREVRPGSRLTRRSIVAVDTAVAASPTKKWFFGLLTSGRRGSKLHVSLWHQFVAPPYGGGNQFMLALRKVLERRGVKISVNRLATDVNIYLLNSIHFDVDRFVEFNRRSRMRVVHRIDGPIHLIRGFDREKDELCFKLNSQFAAATVLQSNWTYQRIVEMQYQPVKPVIVRNAVDPAIFHSHGRAPFDLRRKVKLIATSWSNNPRKGGADYKWLEQHLDWARYEFTFVGNCSEQFDRARCVPAVPSDELAEMLRQHDIFITASQNDPCSNAVVEALACGLPVLYRNDGGHPELVGQGGLPYTEREELLTQLDLLAENYDLFQRLIAVPTMDDVADKYLTLLREAAA